MDNPVNRSRRALMLAAAAFAAIAAAVVIALTTSGSGSGPSEPSRPDPYSYRPFAPTSVWNARLADDVPADPRSRAYVGALRRQVRDSGVWINTREYSTPVYRVGPQVPKVKVTLDRPDQTLGESLAAVPIPAGAQPAPGDDGHLVVHQQSSDTMWELWHARKTGGRWRASWGARMTEVSHDDGKQTAPYGATATGLPLQGGLMRLEEAKAHRIDHALAFALPEAQARKYVGPATRTDGQVDDENAIPLGTRFRLDPDLDIDSLDLSPTAEAMARAVQRYGMIARDKAGSVAFYGEQSRRPDEDPWRSQVFGGETPKQALAGFPWDRLEAVDPTKDGM